MEPGGNGSESELRWADCKRVEPGVEPTVNGFKSISFIISSAIGRLGYEQLLSPGTLVFRELKLLASCVRMNKASAYEINVVCNEERMKGVQLNINGARRKTVITKRFKEEV